jgi:hypothetical protein
MAKRKREQTPDILGNVLSDEEQAAEDHASPTSDDVADDSSAEGEVGRAQDSNPEPGQDDAPAEDEKPTANDRKEVDVSREGKKRKATFYLTEDTLSELEEGWFRLRQMEQGSGGSISKSAIVEVALRHVLSDLDDGGGEDSVLTQSLLELI